MSDESKVQDALGQAGMAYVLAALPSAPMAPNAFSVPGMRAAVGAYLEHVGIDEILKVVFDEGVNYADYDEGKHRPEPDGYRRDADGLADGDEVRRRAVQRALRALDPSKDIETS